MSTETTVGEICQVMDRAYPPHLAESWDSVGLICGRREAPVRQVAFAPTRWQRQQWQPASTC